VIAPLLDVLQSTDSGDRLWAVQALERIGDTQMKWISISGQEIKEFRASGFATAQIRELGEALLEVMLHDSEESVRLAALHVIGRIGVQSKAAVTALTQIVQSSSNKAQRIAAIRVLASMGPQAQEASFLPNLLTDPDGQIPWRVLEALPREWVPHVIPVLTAALKNPAKKIRSRAVTMLIRLGPEAIRFALPALREALLDDDPHVQSHAEEAVRLAESPESGTYSQ
jgi:HEAT repeat protein